MKKPKKKPTYDRETYLYFNSKFESGNLFAVFKQKLTKNELKKGEVYDLILQYDTNTRGNTGWFFYNISNTVKD